MFKVKCNCEEWRVDNIIKILNSGNIMYTYNVHSLDKVCEKSHMGFKNDKEYVFHVFPRTNEVEAVTEVFNHFGGELI